MKYSNEEIEKCYQLAYDYDAEHGFCPQCVLAAIQDVTGLIDEAVFKASQPLAGGTARAGSGTCGALAGGLMAIGVLYGRSYADFHALKKDQQVMQLSKKVTDLFITTYGSVTCEQVQSAIMGRSYKLTDSEEMAAFIRDGGHKDKCAAVCGNTARWVLEVLNLSSD